MAEANKTRKKKLRGNESKLTDGAMRSTAFGLWALDAFEAEKEEFEACCAQTDLLAGRTPGQPSDPDAWLLREIESLQRARKAREQAKDKSNQNGKGPAE